MSTESTTSTQPADTHPEANGERLFTQAELNQIISDRLTRERTKAEPDVKEQALKAREARLDCREYLDTKKLPAALLDALDTSDAERFKTTVTALMDAFHGITATIETRGATVAHPPMNRTGPDPDELIKQAFAPKK